MAELDLFSVPVFLLIFRETLETAIIVSILLAFLKQTLDVPDGDPKVYRALRRQVWAGTAIGFSICLCIAGGVVMAFYSWNSTTWDQNELYYESFFSLFASLMITVMGAAVLRVGKMQAKWRVKLAKAMHAPVAVGEGGWFGRLLERYAMFTLPFVTVLREGVEAIVFIAGVSFSTPPSSVPLATLAGLAFGAAAGYALYAGGSGARLQQFLVAATCLLYMVGAGLFTRAVWYWDQQKWNEAIGGEAQELGMGPGSYDIDKSVWHVNCCSPQFEGGGIWGVLNALTGWTNSATYNSVIAYIVYWVFVIGMFLVLRFKELHGRLPLMKRYRVVDPLASDCPTLNCDPDVDRAHRPSGDSTRALLSRRLTNRASH
ncbi:high-affinity iron permease [Ceratocystis pirilliformis]|uniref:High-affinity iron permease n=1 Tax=Ceratocystis pirilliformis TaxID=259994 RepID=A0ABR3ZI07_9PEZI